MSEAFVRGYLDTIVAQDEGLYDARPEKARTVKGRGTLGPPDLQRGMAYNLDELVPDGNPLPGDDPDTTSPIGDPVPPSDPTEPNGTPSDTF